MEPVFNVSHRGDEIVFRIANKNPDIRQHYGDAIKALPEALRSQGVQVDEDTAADMHSAIGNTLESYFFHYAGMRLSGYTGLVLSPRLVFGEGSGVYIENDGDSDLLFVITKNKEG